MKVKVFIDNDPKVIDKGGLEFAINSFLDDIAGREGKVHLVSQSGVAWASDVSGAEVTTVLVWYSSK